MIEYLLYSLLAQGLFLIAYRLLLRHPGDYQWNRFILLGGLFFSLLLPFLKGQALPSLPGQAPAVYLPDIGLLAKQAVATSAPAEAFPWLTAIWVCGSALSLCMLAYRLFSVGQIIRKSLRERKDGYVLVRVPEGTPPCSIFHYILWPEGSVGSEGMEAILRHELAHVREGHTLDLLFIAVLRCVFWMNPLLYFYGKALKAQHEFEADRRALEHTQSTDYIRLLAQSVLKQADLVYTHEFYSSNLKTRIKMIKSWNNTPISWKQIGGALAFASLMAFGVACTESSVSEESVDQDIAKTENLQIEEIEADSEAIQPAKIVGGFAALSKSLQENLKYPKSASEAGVEGKVMVRFTVQKDGSMSDFSVLKGIGHGCDEAAVSALKASALQWEPAVKDGKIVTQQMVLPIAFAL